MRMKLFGPGAAWAIPSGIQTPMNFGKAKELTFSVDRTVKALTGQFAAPLDFGGGELKIAGKLKLAEVSSLVIASLFWNVTPAAGSELVQFAELGMIPASSSYVVTVANAATFTQELEVIYAQTDTPLTKVASAPSAGQYSVSAGVFTFAAADASKAVAISYRYTTTGGYKLSVTNPLQGDLPIFGVTMYNTKNGLPITRTVPFCVAPKMSFGSKENDWTNPEIDIMIGANAAGQILYENYPQLS